MSELKNCPFCGAEPSLTSVIYDDIYSIRCDDCGASSGPFNDVLDHEGGAVDVCGNELAEKAWNTRSSDQVGVESAKRLAKILHDKHFGTGEKWIALKDIEGVITQIDNMTSGLTRSGGWQEIETAPKSGIYLLGYTNDGGHTGLANCLGQETHYAYPPTHWQPLPAPPEGE